MTEVKKVPNIKSAKKRVNIIKRQTEENIPVKGSMRTAIKKVEKELELLEYTLNRTFVLFLQK